MGEKKKRKRINKNRSEEREKKKKEVFFITKGSRATRGRGVKSKRPRYLWKKTVYSRLEPREKEKKQENLQK